MTQLTPLSEAEFVLLRKCCESQANKIYYMFAENRLEARDEDEARAAALGESLRVEYRQLMCCLWWLDENRKALVNDKRKDNPCRM